MKALLLDTDQSGLLQDVLRERGHDVVVCTGAGEAYDAFRRLAPPLMVLEWGLEGSGERLCKRIRPLPHGDEVVVLALLATDRPGLPTEVLEQGADDYLILPLSADTLRARLVIAERKVSALQRRRRLVESARQMEKAVETMQLGVTITDTEGTIVYANDAEASMHGRARDELLGQDVRLLAPTDLWKPRPSAEKLKAMKRWSRDSLNLRSDGSVFPVRLLSDVVTDDEGRLLGVVTTCEDCSERRNAQEALRKSEERYRTLVETAGDIVCTVSAEGFITSLNTAFQALTDWPREDWIGRRFAPLVHPDDLPATLETFATVLRGETLAPSELRMRSREGVYLAIELHATPMLEEQRVAEVLFVARDITARKLAEALLVTNEEKVRRRQEVQFAVTRALSDSPSVASAAPRLLESICQGLGWRIGLLWICPLHEQELRCAGSWRDPLLDLVAFEAASREAVIARGQGLTGRIWARGEPAWIPDVSAAATFLRAPAAAEAGLRAACAFPVADDHQVIGILEFFSDEIREPDGVLLDMLADIGRQLGQFIKRKEAEERLRESEERFALAMSGTNDGLWDWDLTARRVYYSPRWKAMLGFDEEAIGGTPEEWLDRVHPEDRPRLQAKLAAHLAGESPQFEDEHRLCSRDGVYRWMHTRGSAVRDSNGRAIRMAGAQTDVTDRRSYDALTGLPNRALLLDRLAHSIRRAHRDQGQFAVIFLDLDRFKLVNDSLGHLVGDQLLIAFARRVESSVRPGDTVGRFGGDEFAVLLDPVAAEEEASKVADRIYEDLKAPFDLQGNEIFTSATMGIALGGADTSPEEILRDADTAMYRAKTEGRSRRAVFDSDMRSRVLEQLRLQNELRRAVERQELRVHYQPVLSLEDQRLLGMEALVRWQHPQRGLLLPEVFIKVAEETGLVIALDRWVLREVCRQASAWESAFPGLPPVPVSVNLSGRQFAQPDLIEQIRAALEESRLDPSRLKIEITESAVMENNELVASTVTRLSEMGVRLHIDDFGTGYSALSYLYRFPFETLKIDRSFVARVDTAGDGLYFVRAILNLAEGLGINVIAEGVETAAQLAQLRSLGCTEGQGYYLAPPMEAKEAGEMIGGRRRFGPEI